MAQINDPDLLTQGAETNATGVTFGTPTGRQLAMTATATLPAISAGDFFCVRNHPDTQNNGVWKETGGTPNTSSITATKVTGSDPIAGGPDSVDYFGTTVEKANILYDVATRDLLFVEQNGLSADGVGGQAGYSKMMIDWKDDDFLRLNAPFPLFMIDTNAGKAIIGTNASGVNNGWNWFDSATYSVRTRKLIRDLGWTELDASGNVLAIWPGFKTLGVFEDPINDNQYYQFGDDTLVDDTVDFDFAGAVNEPVQAFERLADDAINGGTGIAISADGRTLTRSDGSEWDTDGFKVGGRALFRDAENSTSDGDVSKVFGGGAFLLSEVDSAVDGDIVLGTAAVATPNGFDFIDGGAGNDSVKRNDGKSWRDEGYFVGGVAVIANAETPANDQTVTLLVVTEDTIEFATTLVDTADTDDNTVTFGPIDPTSSPDATINAAVDNRNQVSLKSRVRDGDTNGKTFGQAGLANAGETELGGFLFKFPLANTTDLKITATDATIDGSTPYTNMTLTIHATPQNLGGPGADELVGGPYDFGFTVDCATGTDVQVHEWVQRQLRKLTNIDDGGLAIGRTIDGLAAFLGDAYKAGSVDNGLTYPNNPQGGGSGVFLEDLNASSRNSTKVFDNLGTERGFPIGTTVTLDFNQTAIDDALAEYSLYFDHTIRNAVADLAVNAGTGPIGTIDSATSDLPASLNNGVGAYIRVAGIIYQVTTIAVDQYDVIRYDGEDVVTVAGAALDLDEHPFDSPDAIIVNTNVPAPVNGLASADFVFTFDYSNNVQGGRTGGTDADVIARAVGQTLAQYTQSSVQTIESGIAITIPVAAQIERNFLNN